jgi:hypothetical protein
VILEGRDLHEPGMHPGQVVVLHEVLGDELPVRVDRVLDAAQEPVLVEPVSREPYREIAQLVLEPRRIRVGTDEHERAPESTRTA